MAENKSEKAKEKLHEVHEKSSGFKKEFIEFINRGSVVDLAVGVAVGGAFTAIVNSLVNDIVMPIVGLIAGGVDFTNLAITIYHGSSRYMTLIAYYCIMFDIGERIQYNIIANLGSCINKSLMHYHSTLSYCSIFRDMSCTSHYCSQSASYLFYLII